MWQADRAVTAEAKPAKQLELATAAEIQARADRDAARAAVAKTREEERKAVESQRAERLAREQAEGVAEFTRLVLAQGSSHSLVLLSGQAKPNVTVKEAMDTVVIHFDPGAPRFQGRQLQSVLLPGSEGVQEFALIHLFPFRSEALAFRDGAARKTTVVG